MRRMHVVGIFAFSVTVGCAPQMQRALREDKSLSLGYPGVSVRPNGTLALATTFDVPSKDTDFLESDDELDTPVRQTSYAVKPHFQIFPGEKSPFYFGAGAVLQSSQYKYFERQNNFSLTSPAYAEIDYASRATYVSIPFGWQPIWENGLTVGSSIEPRIFLSRQGRMTNDGTSENVDVAERDKTLREIERGEQAFGLTFGTFVGYSF